MTEDQHINMQRVPAGTVQVPTTPVEQLTPEEARAEILALREELGRTQEALARTRAAYSVAEGNSNTRYNMWLEADKKLREHSNQHTKTLHDSGLSGEFGWDAFYGRLVEALITALKRARAKNREHEIRLKLLAAEAPAERKEAADELIREARQRAQSWWRPADPDLVKILTERVHTLKRQLTLQQEQSEERNRALKALHYVWNTRGYVGVDRTTSTNLTREIIEAAVRNTHNMVIWWHNHAYRYKKERELAEDVEKMIPELRIDP